MTRRPATQQSAIITARAFRDFPAFGRIIRSRVDTAFRYRLNTVLLLAVILVQIFVLRKVWTTVYAGRDRVDGLSLTAMLTYLTIASLQNWAFQDPTVTTYLRERVRAGQVAFDLIRPMGFVPQMGAHLVGATVATMMFVAVALPIAAAVGALTGPVSAWALALFLLALLLGYVVTALLTLILAMVAFWTVEISGLWLLYYLVNQFFAGALVPISLLPGFVHTLAAVLPFQATTYAPVGIYVGVVSGDRAWQAILVQLVWVAVLSCAAAVMWRRALRRVVVQGG